MREKPGIRDERIVKHLLDVYGLQIRKVEYLPLGADFNAFVYRVEAGDSISYFLKLRNRSIDKVSLLVPQFLRNQGIRHVIAPIPTLDHSLWSSLDGFNCIVYPFVHGRDGFESALTEDQWFDFGTALKQVHTAVLPQELRDLVPAESYGPQWRELVRKFQDQAEHQVFEDSVAAGMSAFLRQHKNEIRFLINRAEALAETLLSNPPQHVLCHSDIHAGNLLITTDGSVFLVDWDSPIMAPKERDLMFIGGGIGWSGSREYPAFFAGYGGQDIDLTALTYYRIERIVEDVAAYSDQILYVRGGIEDRELGFRYFTSQFEPGDVIDIALATDRKLRAKTGEQ